MKQTRSLHSGIRRALGWLLSFSMTLSLLPAMAIVPARAAGGWSLSYDPSLVGADLTVELYDADSHVGEIIIWTDGDGTRTADRSAGEIFGDGHRYYAVTQYLDSRSVVAEYKNYMIAAMSLAAQWEALPDTDDTGEECKADYGTGADAYDNFVEAKLSDLLSYTTPEQMKDTLDSLAAYGQYTPTGDYSIKMLARTVALEGDDPVLNIGADFFDACAPVEWTLPDESFSSGGSGFPGGDYSDILGGGSTGSLGGDFSDYLPTGSGYLQLLFQDGDSYIPALVSDLLTGGVEEDDSEAAGSAYLAQRMGLGSAEEGNPAVDGKVDVSRSLYMAPGSYGLVYSDSTGGETLLDWEKMTVSDQGGSVDFSSGRSYGTLTASWTGFLEESVSNILDVSITGDTVPGTLTLSLGEGAVKCPTGSYQITAISATENWVDMSSIDISTGAAGDLSNIPTRLVTTGLAMEEDLSITAGVNRLELGDLPSIQWQGKLDVVSAETGLAKDSYTPGEELKATMALSDGKGLELLYSYAMYGLYIDFATFMADPSDAAFDSLFTVPKLTLSWLGSEDILAQGPGFALTPLTFSAPETTKMLKADYSYLSADGTIDITADSSAAIPVEGNVEVDTQPPAVPTGFSGEISGAITFSWAANTEADLAGYRLYRTDSAGTVQGGYLQQFAPDATIAQLSVSGGWGAGPWYFVLSAFDQVNNESAYSQPVVIQDPNADFFGKGTFQVTEGTIEEETLVLTKENTGELTFTFTADPTLPAAGLPDTISVAVKYRDLNNKSVVDRVTLIRDTHTYTGAWSIPEDGATLETADFEKDGAAVAQSVIDLEVSASLTVTIPLDRYPLGEKFTTLRLTSVVPSAMLSADLTGENGTFSGYFLRRALPNASAFFRMEDFPNRALRLAPGLFGGGGAVELTVEQMPDAALVIPSWTPEDTKVTANIQILDADGKELNLFRGHENAVPVLLTPDTGASQVKVHMVTSHINGLEVTGSEDSIFSGVPWEKGSIYTAQGLTTIRGAEKLLDLDIFWGENGDTPYDKSTTLTLTKDDQRYTTTWYPSIRQADVTDIPAGTYTLAFANGSATSVTLTGAEEVTAPPLRVYKATMLSVELNLPLSPDQPDGVVEELEGSGNLQRNWVAPLKDNLTLYYRDKSGAAQVLPGLVVSVNSSTGMTRIEGGPVYLRDIDLEQPLEVDIGDAVQLYTFSSSYGGIIYYTPYRSASIPPTVISTTNFSRTETIASDICEVGKITLSGSQSIRLNAVPVIQVTATRTVKATNAYFLFVDEAGNSTLEIRSFEASRGGGVQRFSFGDLKLGTYDVLFYLSDKGRDQQLERSFITGTGDFTPHAQATALGKRGVVFDNERNLCSLDTPAEPVNEAVSGIQGVSVTPSKPTVLEGDLLSFTTRFTYVPGDQPVTLRLVSTNFDQSSDAISVSLKTADGTDVPCPVSGDTLTIPNDRGTLTGTIIYSGITDIPGGEVINASNSAHLSVELADGGAPGLREWYWSNSVRVVPFYSNLAATVQGTQTAIQGRAPTGTFTAEIVSLRNASSVAATPITTSEYGYWKATLDFPFTVKEGPEDFQVTFKRADGSVLNSQKVTATPRPNILPSVIRYGYYYTSDRYVTLVGLEEDNYQAIRDAVINFYTGYGQNSITIQAEFDDQEKNEYGYTDAQLVANPCLLVENLLGLYYFDLIPMDKKTYSTPQGNVPYATTYSATFRDIYYGPFEVCFDILDPNGITVPEPKNSILPESELAELTQEWAALSELIYESGGKISSLDEENTFVLVAEDAAIDEALTADVFAKEGISAQQREELKEVVMIPDTPTDMTFSITHKMDLTAVDDIEGTIRALDALEDEDCARLYYSREEREDGVVAYVRHFDPLYAFLLSDEQPENPDLVNLDLVMVQSYVYLYDLTDITQPAAAAASDMVIPTPGANALPPSWLSPSQQIAWQVGAENLITYGTAITKGTAVGLMEAGDIISKGIDMVTTTNETVEMLDLEPESVGAAKKLDEKMFGSKGAKVLKGVGIAKSVYDAGNKFMEGDPENNAKKDALAKIHGELTAQRDASLKRCTCLLDENGEAAQRQIYQLYQDGLNRIDDLITAIEVHENTDLVLDLVQGVVSMPEKLDTNVYKKVADYTIDSTQEIAWSMHDSQRWQSVRDVYQECYNGMSLASFKCDPTKCENQEPKVIDNLARAESKYTGPIPGPIPASPVDRITPEFIIDPSGVVFEGLLSNPLAGVECTIQYLDGEVWTDWTQAPGYNDQRPVITTDDSGYYRWDVPQGSWRVKYYKEGYNGDQPIYSDTMPVPPVWLDVNQNMLANDSAPIAAISSEDGAILVTFDTPTQWDTISSGASVTIGGAPAEGSWSILSGGEGDIYPDGVTFGPDGRPAETSVKGQLVTQIKFTPATKPVNGSSFTLFLTGGVESYAGDGMAPVTLPGTIVGGTSGGGTGGGSGSGGGSSSSGGSGGTAASHRATVTASPNGGSYTAFDGDVTLDVGKGSFTAKTDIKLERGEGSAYGDSYTILFSVQPKDTVEFTFTLDPSAAMVEDTRKLGLWVKKDGSQDWTFAGGAYDPAANTLTLLTRMDGEYEVRYHSQSFSDLNKSHWAFDFMDILSARGIMQGNAQGQAEPNRTITRAEVAAMLVKVLQANSLIDRLPAVEDSFTDTVESDWYYYPLNLAAKRGLIAGYDDGRSGALDNITREQLATMLANAVATDQELAAAGAPAFKDADQISGWAKPFVAVLQDKGFMVGDEYGNFDPQAKATRAETAVLMYRAMELYGLLYLDPDAPELPCLTCPYSR